MASPFSISGASVIERLQQGLNHILGYDPETRAALAELEGSVLAIEIREPALHCFLLPNCDGLQFSLDRPSSVNVTVTGRPLALLGMLTRKDTAQGHVEIRGDIHLAQQFQQIMRQLNIDWEEFLACHIGDVAAHQMGRFGRRFQRQLRTAGDTLRQQILDYLLYEQRQLPLQHEFEDFSRSVSDLRDALARAEQRLQRLQNNRVIQS